MNIRIQLSSFGPYMTVTEDMIIHITMVTNKISHYGNNALVHNVVYNMKYKIFT